MDELINLINRAATEFNYVDMGTETDEDEPNTVWIDEWICMEANKDNGEVTVTFFEPGWHGTPTPYKTIKQDSFVGAVAATFGEIRRREAEEFLL
jgi:hypothetical protein